MTVLVGKRTNLQVFSVNSSSNWNCKEMSNYTDLLELWCIGGPVIRTSFEKQAAVDKNTGFHVR